VVSIKRGSKLGVKVLKSHGAPEVLRAGVQKHAAHDQFFCAADEYLLIYPDQKVVDFVPGSNVPFTVERYKDELGKPYAKLDLYICCVSSFEDETTETTEAKKDFNNGDFAEILHGLFSSPHIEDELPLPVLNLTETDITEIQSSNEQQPSCSSNHVNSKPTHKVLCPICNSSFPVGFIEEHANACLESRNRRYFADDVLVSSDDEEVVECGDSQEFMEVETQSLANLIQSIITVDTDKDGVQTIQIQVKRGYEFEDFMNVFKKKHNKKKVNHSYMMSFVGESGIDTGGVSREFYSDAISELKDVFCGK